MSIQQQFILRYKNQGYVRFQVPVQICQLSVAKILSEHIAELEGIYRVNLYRRQKKLAIRFHEDVCSFTYLSKQLAAILTHLEQQGLLKETLANDLSFRTQFKNKLKNELLETRWGQWTKQRYFDLKETIHAAKIIGKASVKKPEQTMVNFLNDVLILYLIKQHWHSITQHWVVNPLKHRYEWSTVFYMFYLLMRSRKSK